MPSCFLTLTATWCQEILATPRNTPLFFKRACSSSNSEKMKAEQVRALPTCGASEAAAFHGQEISFWSRYPGPPAPNNRKSVRCPHEGWPSPLPRTLLQSETTGMGATHGLQQSLPSQPGLALSRGWPGGNTLCFSPAKWPAVAGTPGRVALCHERYTGQIGADLSRRSLLVKSAESGSALCCTELTVTETTQAGEPQQQGHSVCT